MNKYFGTDGIRGIVHEELTKEIIFKCGNAISKLKKDCRILIGRDTRLTGDFIVSEFSAGAMLGGANIIDIGICPTPAVSFLVEKLAVDFGVVISASHNEPEYNGIKVFDSNGLKIGENLEQKIEENFEELNVVCQEKTGRYKKDCNAINLYIEKLKSIATALKGLKIVLDLANGASFDIAPKVFSELGAEVIAINKENNGSKINVLSGATNPEVVASAVKKYTADLGLSFDGDADRIIAVDENGTILDGDKILYTIAKYLKRENCLKNNNIVCTEVSNMGLEKSLNELDIAVVKTAVGDKFVSEKMEEIKAELGGENSGHIILRSLGKTGDGIAVGLMLSKVLLDSGKKLSQISRMKTCPQIQLNIKVLDKKKIVANKDLIKLKADIENKYKDDLRIVLRASGTENKVRVIVQGSSEELVNFAIKELEKKILEIDGGK